MTKAIALALAASGAHAATITVTDNGDGNSTTTCTLRQAIDAANNQTAVGSCTAGTGSDTINFANGISSIALTQGQLLIDSSVTISGSGQTITAAANSRVMGIYFNNATAPIVNLTNLTLTGGTSGPGAGLLVSYRTPLASPTTQPARQGKALNAVAPYAPVVTLDQVTISGNSSTIRGGGVYVGSSTVVINQSTISGNSFTGSYFGAGGVYIRSGDYGSSVTITNSTISGNSASGSGNDLTGGIYAYGAQLSITNSTITGNSASGGNFLAGSISLKYTTAGIYDSTITGNTTTTANVAAGGILVGGSNKAASLTLVNTILSGNTSAAPADLYVSSGSAANTRYDLLGTVLQTGYAGSGNVFSDTPTLGTLTNNGGPTQTMLPQPGSPALDKGSIALIPAGVTTDQRGTGFPRVTNGALDIGAVQVGPAPAVVTVPTPALSRWALLALGGLLALFGLRKRRHIS